MHPEKALAIPQGCIRKTIDLLHGDIFHGKTADGNTTAMDHQIATGPFMVAVVCIWIAKIKGEMELAERIHLAGTDDVKTFGGPSVPLPRFWPQPFAAIGTDRILSEQFKGGCLQHPDFENFFSFEHPDKNGGAPLQSFTDKCSPKGCLPAQDSLPGAHTGSNGACMRLNRATDCKTEQSESPTSDKTPPF